MKFWKRFSFVSQSKGLTRRTITWLWFLLPSLLGVMLFYILPFADVIRRSFVKAVTMEYTGLDNYQMVFHNEAFILAMKNTGCFLLVCLPALILFSFFIAVALSRTALRKIFKSFLLIPMAVPAATIAVVWRMLLNDYGQINGVLAWMGLPTVDFLGSNAAFWVLVVTYIWKNLGYTTLLWMAGMESISDALTEAARVDGANENQCLYHIVVPNLKPTLYTIVIISFLNSFKVFREEYLVAGAYPQPSIYLLQHLFNNWYTNLELDKMAAAAVIIFIILLITVMFLKRVWDGEEAQDEKKKSVKKSDTDTISRTHLFSAANVVKLFHKGK